MYTEKNKPYGPFLAALGAVVLWCWTGVCFRKGSELIGAMVYLTWMTGIGSLTAVLLHCVSGQPLSAAYRLPFRVLAAGFLGVSVYSVMIAAAFGMAPEADLGQVNLLNLLWPFWVVFLGFFLLTERPRPVLALFGILLGLAGVLVSRGFDQLAGLPSRLTAPALALAGGFMWALYSVLLRKWKTDDNQSGTAFNFAVCSVMAGTIAFFTGEWKSAPALTTETVFWILFGGIGPVGLAYSWWEIGVKKGPVFLIASLAYFIPIGSSLLIGLVYKESMNSGLLFGAVLIAAGAWMVKLAGPGAQS